MVAAAEERGQPVPLDILPLEPDLYEGDEFFLNAFWSLGTTRQVGFGIGPIPVNHMLEWARMYEMDFEMTRLFVEIIREMDAGYLEWHSEKMKRDAVPK